MGNDPDLYHTLGLENHTSNYNWEGLENTWMGPLEEHIRSPTLEKGGIKPLKCVRNTIYGVIYSNQNS